MKPKKKMSAAKLLEAIEKACHRYCNQPAGDDPDVENQTIALYGMATALALIAKRLESWPK